MSSGLKVGGVVMPYIPDGEQKEGLGAMVGAFEEPYHEYWYHLGRFIHAFARAEAALLFLLRDVSGLSKRRAGVLFNGVRSDEARVTINGFLDATKQPEKKNRLKRPFAQIAAIGTIRNNIVHWGATTDLGLYFTVSNIDRSPLRLIFYTSNRQGID